MGSATRIAAVLAASGLLAACSQAQLALHAGKKLEAAVTDPVAEANGAYKVGDPYKIDGVVYTPKEDFAYDETGVASWYGPGFHGNRTANGAIFDQNALTAAHPTLQMPSKVQVTNLENGRSLALVVNDRGPYKRGRILDVSRRSAQLLGFDGNGTARVRVRLLPEESLQLAAVAGRKGAAPVLIARADPSATVSAVPRDAVQVAALAPAENGATPLQPVAPRPAAAAAGPVTVVPVRPTGLFVQAGAFLNRGNAERLRARLAPVGNAAITETVQGQQTFYRVRVGPLATVQDADRTLGRLVALGQSDARVVVD